ncbi:MAG: carboxypeptidase-like regulatory domain-containing protein, partial [Bryobacteraceae bacterium]
MKREVNDVSSIRLAVRCLAALVCLLLVALAAFGQGGNGSFTGTITDSSGAVVPNVSIEVKNSETGAVFRGGTSNTGNYVVSVQAGQYELTVTASGFKKFVRSNLVIQTASNTRLDVMLEVGAVSDTVTVTDVAPLMKTESGEISHTMATSDINNLPVLTTNGGGGAFGNIRDPLQEIVLLPGTNYQNGLAVVVNGLPANSESIRIEGQDSTSNIWKIAQQNSQGGVDAIQEVAIQTSNFAAEYGQAAGGYFNYTMKSGTNAFHGSAYDYLVNEAMNAGLPFSDRCTQNGLNCVATADRQHIRNRLRRNDYGATFGGPIKIPKVYDGTNKTFFFLNFEQFRQNNLTGNGLTTVPTTAYQGGDFSQALCSSVSRTGVCSPFNPITQTVNGVTGPAVDPAGNAIVQGQLYDPYTTHLVQGTNVRLPYANNLIPNTALDPVSLAIQKLLPQPNTNLLGNTNNYNIPSYTSFQHTTNVSVKLDHSISSTIKISGYYSQ